MFFTYVLYSRKFDKIYIGQTNNLRLRLEEHNSGMSKSTKRDTPWEIIYFEKYETRSEAMKREKQLKSHTGRDFIRKEVLKKNI